MADFSRNERVRGRNCIKRQFQPLILTEENSMKKLYFGSNLKMYKGIEETVSYLRELEELTKGLDADEMQLFIIPSYTALPDAVKTIDQKNIKLGAQNMCWEEQGQYTGEISPLMLKELGIQLVLIGHSERRHVFREKDYEENLKVKTALEHGFIVLLCIGETAEEKEYGISKEVLKSQLKIALHDVEVPDMPNIWVAYEPVWSIGESGVPASADYAERMHQVIKSTLLERFGDLTDDIPVLYGGSVNRENAVNLITKPSIDGLFVGRAAWQAGQFEQLIKDAKRAAQRQLE